MKSQIKSFKTIFRTDTVKDTGIVLTGQVLATIFSAIFFFCIARALGPAKLGIYTTVVAIFLILTDTLDLAINSSIIKFISSPNKATYLKFAFLLKLFIGSSLLILLFAGARFYSNLLHQDIESPLRIASVLILATFLYRFSKSVFQGEKKFSTDAILDILLSFSRLLIVLVLIFFSKLTINSIFIVHIISTLGVFFIGINKISLDFWQAKIEKSIAKKFFSFQGWLSVGFILAAIHSRVDILILMRFSGPEMVGFYQAGYRFFMPIIQFSSVLSTVFAPRFSGFASEDQARIYLKKTILLSSFLSLLVLIFIFFIPAVVNIFYGSAFQNSIPPSKILALGFSGFVFGIPFISYLIYRSGKTFFFAFLNLIQLILIVSLDLILIPKYGVSGAAWATAITLWLVNAGAAIYVLK